MYTHDYAGVSDALPSTAITLPDFDARTPPIVPGTPGTGGTMPVPPVTQPPSSGTPSQNGVSTVKVLNTPILELGLWTIAGFIVARMVK